MTDRKDELELRLTKVLQTLIDRSGNAPLAATLRSNNIHATDIRVQIDPDASETTYEKIKRELRESERWRKLREETRMYKWDEFYGLCTKKVDVTARWRPIIAEAIGVQISVLQYREKVGYVPHEWLAPVAALPDWKPDPDGRINFPKIAVELVAALRSSAKSSAWIAATLTAFLREFDGDRVQASDVTRTRPL